jgi:hypothetical protein
MKYLILVLVVFSQWVCAAPQEIDDYHWTGVERIVAIGDIHGDYSQYMATLEAAGLVNAKGKWTGGQSHLVQNGDIPDRGPDSAKIIRHLAKLSKEASKSGGRVHALIGNHEAMNVYGDLRYVSAGEYAAFATRNSDKMRDRYFEAVMQDLQKRDPEKFAALPPEYRQEWDTTHPLGWVEHRQAWDPAWNPKGEFWLWVQSRKVAIQINDLVFLHGGISGFYCQNSLQSLTDKVIAGLSAYDPANPGILEDEFGPLWYRGMSGEAPEASAETVQAILKQQAARHVVVGHTPTSGIVWPRYQGQVIQIDTGISAAYGGHLGYLEVTPEGLFAGYSKGKVALPKDDAGLVAYLEQVIALDPGNAHLKELLASLNAAPVISAPEPDSAEPGASEGGGQVADQGPMATDIGADTATHAPDQGDSVPTCGISG